MINMKIISQKQLFVSACVIVVFFIMIFVNAYILKSSAILAGVLQELLLMPMLILQVFILFFAIKKAFQVRFTIKGLLFWTIVMMSLSVLITFGSFVV